MTIPKTPFPWMLVLTVGCAPGDDGSPDDSDEIADTDETADTDDTDVLVTNCTVTPPGTWEAPDWASNTTVALALRGQLDTLSSTMANAEKGTATVDELSDLTSLFEAGDPSLADVINPAFEDEVEAAFAEFLDVVAVGAADLVDEDGVWTPGAAGGVIGTSSRGLNEGGVEVRQIVDKGLFAGAGHYRWAASLTEGTITPATIDAIAAAFGGNATWDTATGQLQDSANYAFPMGRLAGLVTAFTAAKAYAADPECTVERDAAIVDVFRRWEEAQMARYAFYAHQAAARMASASAETVDNDVAEAIHGVSEGLGLVAGFGALPEPAAGPLADAGIRTITDAGVADAIAPFDVDLLDLGAGGLGDLVTDPTALEAAAEALEDVLAEVYGWDEADRAAIRTPTPG